ncbi:hypothetical protein F4777DRAFT_446238 [Nemania sp. FL0916]|nr:hypothetical protein F4777DRAFT_446238 [Nemania sp. FL0916]
MPPTPSTITTTSPKIKLRNACNNCCAAKVKCSGERSGCERCRNAETTCVYGESMVGRVPGLRAKRKQAPGEDLEQRNVRRGSMAQWSANLTPDSTGAVFQATDQGALIMWPSNWQSQQETVDSVDVLSTQPTREGSRCGSYNSRHTSSATDTSVPLNADTFFTDLLLPQSPAPTPTEDAQDELQIDQSERLSKRPRKRSTEDDSRCCLECCQIIYDLENYIVSELKAFNIILGIIRQTYEKLNELVESQRDSLNPRCSTLFSTILYQILELMAMCLSIADSERGEENGRPSIGISMGLGLGYSSIDADEQSKLGVRIIAKEARRATELLHKLRSLSPRSGNGAGTDRGGASRDVYIDLELRFQEISSRSGSEG